MLKRYTSREVRSRRVGGATFQIQCKLDQTEKISMAMKWLILYSRRRNESLWLKG
jgi:small subunit ribosomal protein S7